MGRKKLINEKFGPKSAAARFFLSFFHQTIRRKRKSIIYCHNYYYYFIFLYCTICSCSVYKICYLKKTKSLYRDLSQNECRSTKFDRETVIEKKSSLIHYTILI